MLKTCLLFFCFTLLSLSAYAQDRVKTHANIQTSLGNIVIELYPEKAPATVANFLQYAEEGHYDRTLIHRVVAGYVIQGGGYSRYFNERPTRDPIAYEGDNGLKNERGTIAMARGDDRNSAAAQWYVNLKNNEELDHKTFEGLPVYGYAVFGRVVEGMDVADAIGAVATGPGGDFEKEVPLEPILIKRIDPIDWTEEE
ncbi:MAG: peptidylprolyl isomerase [Pseudomonadota bacterium]